jgi:excinuclease ABC subunit C
MQDISNVPDQPGCYLFRSKEGEIIYVGKAKILKKRVSSYFQKKNHDPKTALLVSKIHSVDFIATATEADALLLENNLVKKHQPKYNIDLKDGKRFAYVEVTGEDFPRVVYARDRTGDGTYFGPMTSAAERDMIIEAINKHFMLRTCKKFPKRPCVRYHIGLCKAPCAGKISKDDYSRLVEDAKLILKGDIVALQKKLEADMKQQSAKEAFEDALESRDKIFALECLKESQSVERSKKYDEDVIAFASREGKAYVLVFNVYKGTLVNKRDFVFDDTADFRDEFMLQYYSENPIPSEIITRENLDESMTEYFSKQAGRVVRSIVPERGEKKDLLELAENNIEIAFFGNLVVLDALKDRLQLMSIPSVVECFDISHLSGTAMVGSMVQFKEGVPNKSCYRRFKIKAVEGIDDFAAIAEVVRRRYSRLLMEKKELPDLVIIDGGLGQLNAALAELKKLSVKIPIISIAKRLEEIYVPGLSIPLRLDRKDKALQLIRQIRDEAHRFAIAYNRLLRTKKIRE